ncbi:MAG: hypothetical protein Q7S35_13780 [Candidatus Limnocylindrales bacterium]|nr:hypothetical protein [Candidatus Limnocylindrales bacterium]
MRAFIVVLLIAGCEVGALPDLAAPADLAVPADLSMPVDATDPGDMTFPTRPFEDTLFRGSRWLGDPVADLYVEAIRAWALAQGVRWMLIWNVAAWCISGVADAEALERRWKSDRVLERGGLFAVDLSAGPETPGGPFGTQPSSWQGNSGPATDDDVPRWMATFGITYPTLHDGFGGTPQNVLGELYQIGHNGIVVDLQTLTLVADTALWTTSVDDAITQFETYLNP